MATFVVWTLSGLTFLLVSIFIYTVFRRVYSNRVDRRMTALEQVYDGLAAAARAGTADPARIREAIPKKDFPYFERYLRNTISGTGPMDVSAHRTLARASGFADHRRRLAARSRGWKKAIAVRTLSYLRDPDDIPLFRKVLTDARLYPCVSAASLGLALCSDTDSLRDIVKRLAESNARNRDLLMTVLYSFGGSAAPSLHRFLAENFLPVTEACVLVDLLGLFRYREAKPTLEKMLTETKSPEVRIHTIEALGLTGDETTCDAVLPFLEDNDFRVQLKALHAVGELGSEKHIERIEALLRDDNRWVRRNAAEALHFLGAPGVALLETAAASGDSPAARTAALILNEMKFRKERWRYRHAEPAA